MPIILSPRPVLWSGLAPSLRLSTAGAFFCDNLPAAALAVLGAYAAGQLVLEIYQGSNLIRGIFGGAGVGETTTELLTDGDMEAAGIANWTAYNATVTKDATAHGGSQALKVVRDGGVANASQAITAPAGTLLKIGYWRYGDVTNTPALFVNNDRTATGGAIYNDNSPTYTTAAWQERSAYRTQTLAGTIYVGLNSGTTLAAYSLFDDVSVGAVTAPSASGCTSLVAPGGAAGWVSVAAGFQYGLTAADAYRLVIRRVR